MCLINFHLHDHPHYQLVLAANRDESYDRPTAPAYFWKDDPNILAGRDLRKMGTWLGISKTGRFAALTNFRDFSKQNKKDKVNSRGEIVHNFLSSSMKPENYLHDIHRNKDQYDGFNVLVGDINQLYYYNNIEGEIKEVPSGTHSVSNHMLNTPWPKVVTGKQRLREHIMNHEYINPDSLFDILSDHRQADDKDLPETGVGLELERKLSPLFIKTDYYGTRSSTVLLIDKNQQATFIERTYKAGKFLADKKFTFKINE